MVIPITTRNQSGFHIRVLTNMRRFHLQIPFNERNVYQRMRAFFTQCNRTHSNSKMWKIVCFYYKFEECIENDIAFAPSISIFCATVRTSYYNALYMYGIFVTCKFKPAGNKMNGCRLSRVWFLYPKNVYFTHTRAMPCFLSPFIHKK